MLGVLKEKCWICGISDATTGEHKTKRTDLGLAFQEPTQSNPLFLHDANRGNQHVRSFDAQILKSSGRICADCNNARTQPHDQAWTDMSEWLEQRHDALEPGTVIRTNRIFRHDTKRKMLAVHLFFIKLFGCMIKESDRKVPIDVASLGQAIMSNRAHPNIYLKFATAMGYMGRSNLELQHSDDFQHIFACWMYQLNWLTVIVMYATPGEQRLGLQNSWHPRFDTNRLVLVDGDPDTGASSAAPFSASAGADTEGPARSVVGLP